MSLLIDCAIKPAAWDPALAVQPVATMVIRPTGLATGEKYMYRGAAKAAAIAGFHGFLWALWPRDNCTAESYSESSVFTVEPIRRRAARITLWRIVVHVLMARVPHHASCHRSREQTSILPRRPAVRLETPPNAGVQSRTRLALVRPPRFSQS